MEGSKTLIELRAGCYVNFETCECEVVNDEARPELLSCIRNQKNLEFVRSSTQIMANKFLLRDIS